MAAVVVALVLSKKEDDKEPAPKEERFERIFGIEPFDIEPRKIKIHPIPVEGIQGTVGECPHFASGEPPGDERSDYCVAGSR